MDNNSATQSFSGRGAQRIEKYTKLSVWAMIAQLTTKYETANLGIGYPSGQPAKFITDSIEKYVKEGPHQYQRSLGMPQLVKSIERFYSPILKRELDGMKNVCVSTGAMSVLNSTILGILNPGDEVILFEPTYDSYRAQINTACGVVRNVPLVPRRKNSQADMKNRPSLDYIAEYDAWDIDFDLLVQSFNDKTKLIILNSPHNPTGKIFTQEELQKIYDLVKQYPKCLVIEDTVYEHLPFDGHAPFEIPRFVNLCEDAWNRTVSVFSAGKLFSITGIRLGWAIGPADLIGFVNAIHQFTVYGLYAPLQLAVADSLDAARTNGYFQEKVEEGKRCREQLARKLIESSIPFSFWIPQGGFFMLADISDVEVPEEYFKEEGTGNPLTKDLAFAVWLIKEKGVAIIPCSFMYSQEHIKLGENIVRFAICKSEEEIEAAGKKLASA